MTPAYVPAMTLTTALGRGLQPTLAALRERRSGLGRNEFGGSTPETWTGFVGRLDGVALPIGMDRFDCRSNRLVELALLQDGFADAVLATREKYGAARIGLYIGTVHAGVLEVELGYRVRAADVASLPDGLRYREAMNRFSPAAYARERFEIRGPAAVVSNAGASSAKAFASAARAIAAGLCDAAIVGGVETLSLSSLHGFGSLGMLSRTPCRPCDIDRDGMSLGEACSLALLTRERDGARVALLGHGEAADARETTVSQAGDAGAARALRAALACARLRAAELDYVNLAASGTRDGDLVEDAALRAVLGDDVARSSTQGSTGHALGAAGIVQAAVSMLAIREGFVPGTLNCTHVDPAIGGNVVLDGRSARIGRAACISSGFGAHCTLVFGGVA
jgi:3-oxoacyl-[acyl-carrier-protein] synthase-1